jgi:hypothetical protein
MAENMRAALRVLDILGLKPTWPLIGAVESAIQTDAKSSGYTIEEAAETMAEEACETRRRGQSVEFFAQWNERRIRRMKRLTSKEQRRAMHGEAYIGDCPACACGNLEIKQKHNGKLFVGCDCFSSDCPCEFSFAVPEQLPIPHSDSREMTEIERAKAIIAIAPKCLNHGVPMTGRIGPYGLFACCTVKGCTYRKSVKTAEPIDDSKENPLPVTAEGQ